MTIPYEELPAQFACDCGDYTVLPLNVGHINKTFKVLRDQEPRFLLQQVNSHVFKDIDALMQNTLTVLDALQEYMLTSPEKLIVQKLVRTNQGGLYFTDDENNHWRMFTFIKGGKTIETVRKYNIAYEGGKAYGLFLDALSSVDPELITPVIPDFHSLEMRYGAFQEALSLNLAKRVDEVKREVDFVESRFRNMMHIPELMKSGSIPSRVVHNDTKFNNLIFSTKGDAIAVTDLDTVMPGSALFDFGDAIRSAANTAREDEPDISKVKFDISIFEAFASGYLTHTEGLLTEAEANNFPEAAMLLTYIIGVRFLTDYLNGDIYYKTRYPEHNLVRARVQFQLIREMEEQYGSMQTVMKRIKTRLLLFNSQP